MVKRIKLILMMLLVISLLVACSSDVDVSKKDDSNKKEKQEDTVKENKKEKENPDEKDVEEEVFDTATPITPFYANFEDFPKNKVPSLLDDGNGAKALISGDARSDKDVCIDTKEKALSYLSKAKTEK